MLSADPGAWQLADAPRHLRAGAGVSELDRAVCAGGCAELDDVRGLRAPRDGRRQRVALWSARTAAAGAGTPADGDGRGKADISALRDPCGGRCDAPVRTLCR